MKKMGKKMAPPKKKKMAGPMNLEEMNEAYTNVDHLVNADLAGAASMSTMDNTPNLLMSNMGNMSNVRELSSEGSNMSNMSKKESKVAEKHTKVMMKGKAPSGSRAVTSPKVKAKEIILGREDLYDSKLEQDFYPLHHLKSVLSKIKSKASEGGEIVLDFTGVEQISDLVFYLFHTSNEDLLKKVTTVDLTGCLRITDQGIIWMASAFTGLKAVKLNGCKHVTETGLYQLLKLCKNLHEINIQGTSVSILPKDIHKYSVNIHGYPVISPEREIFNKGGFKLLQAPGYSKTVDEDLVKLCVIHGSKSTKSLIKHLTVEYVNDLEPLIVKYNFKIRSNYTANIVECDETICDLFITKRTLFVLPVQVTSSESKTEARRLFGLMCYIIAKVQNAAFIVVALSEDNGKMCSSSELKAELTSLISAKKGSLTRELLALKQLENFTGTTFPQQESWKGKCLLAKALDNLFVEYCDVNMKQPYKESDPLQTSIIKGMKAVCDLYPEFQEIAQPVFAYAMSDSIQKTLKEGVLSLETSKPSNFKMMEFLAIMGKTVCTSILQDVPIVCLSSWLAKVVSVAGTPPPDCRNQGRVLGVSDEAPMWQLDAFRTALEPVIGTEQAATGVSLLIKLGMSVHRSVFLSFRTLDLQPTIPVEQFFPEVSNAKDKDLFSSVFYRLDCDFVLPNFVIHKLMWLCCKMRRPVLAWQAGFILQDSFVETLFEIVKKDSGSSLNFCVHMVAENDWSKNVIQEMIWNTVEHYKIILDYILKEVTLPCTYNLIIGKTLPSGQAPGLISSHQWKTSKEDDDLSDSGLHCHICGSRSKTSCIPWILYGEINHSCWNSAFLKQRDADVSMSGNILTFEKKGKCYLMTPIEATEQNACRFTFLSGPVASTKVSLGFVLNQKALKTVEPASEGYAEASAFLMEIQLDLSDGYILSKRAESIQKIGDIPANSLPRLGESLGMELKEIDGNTCELRFYRDKETIGKIMVPRHRYLPSIECANSELSVMIHPIMKDSLSKNTELSIGMRLEALDRKNPHLICVATITDIADDGKVKIHFDGWNSGSYDYYTEFSSKDLHPVGWCSKNMSKYRRLNQELQAPKGYHGQFLWPKYCVDEGSYPVPMELFSEEQIETPSLIEQECLQALDGAGFDVPTVNTAHSRCRTAKFRPRMFEQKALEKCTMSPALFDFFSNQSKFLCLLPAKFDVDTLKCPSMKGLMNYKEQNVHILCPGLKIELLHLVDYKGTKLSNGNISAYAAYLQNCYIGLLIQEGGILPDPCPDLCSGIDKGYDAGQVDMWLKRICFMNVCILEFILYVTKSIGNSVRDVMDIFSECMKDSKPRLMFQQSETYVRCIGHVLSSMAGNELNSVPIEKYAQFYPFIQKLDFQNNFIERLPADFFEKFINLEHLAVSNNQLVTLPNGLERLKYLSYLDIAMNNILELPSNFDVLAGTLVYLNISDNPLSTLPDVIFKLTKLEELYAENIGEIQDFSKIKDLTELNTLSLARNAIQKVPEELSSLPLVSLDMSGVPWFEQLTTTKTFLSYRAFNQTLNSNVMTNRISEKDRQELFKTVDADESSTLTANEVLGLNDVLCKKYPRFGSGALEYSETGGIPPPILKLKKLKTLVLKYHTLKFIPDEIKDLTALKEFDLSHNPQITSLSAELSGLALKMIHLRECPLLKTPPKEIVARGFVAVMGYLKRLRLGASPCKRTKLMLVGLGGAGKTSLVSALMNSRYRAYMDHDEAITDGIDISKWVVPIKGESDPLTFSVWDFAGQTVYYNTHQFFLSNRAVYLLLWNVRQGYEHAGLDFWLSSIACHAPKAPILVVGTHSDKVEKCRLPEASIQARFPQIIGFYYVSSYTGDGIPGLKKAIVDIALQQKYMGEKIPEAWLNLEKKLIVLREEQNKDFLLLKQLDAVAQSIGIFDTNELIQAIQFLHDLGAAQFFDTDFLRSIVVIYPQWIVDVMACLVTVHQGVVKDGRLEMKDISGVWKDYPTELHPWLLRLTEEFDLTCPLPDKETSIVPCLLPDAEPRFEWPHAEPEKNIKESLTIYKFQYLPAGLFNRAQARLHQYSEGTLLWKRGSFLKKNDHKAVLLQTDDSEVIVRAQGFRPENFLFLVHEIIETLIAESYAGVHYDFLVPCLECLNMNVKDPSMVSYMKVQRALELNAPFLQCDKFFHILSIAELRDTMPSDKMSEIDNHLRSSVRELIDLESERTINVFFVYSTKNVPGLENENTMVHPGTVMEDLRKHSDLRLSFSDKPETSDMEAITLSVKMSNVVIIGMSDEFCADPECQKLLLYIKDVLRKPILLLLLGKTKNWQKGNLNMVFGSEVYVDMQKIERYPHKIQELYEAIKKKAATASKAKEEDVPNCFISYCWTNSHDAIAKGSRSVEGALGWEGGDPRTVKEFLEEKGIRCWIDIEKVGGTGLFHSIADGLREAKIMIAFVSDEYVKSKNCIMEFRYALTTLRIPVIVVVVGTGYTWERSEVGLLVVGHACPKVNFQFANGTGNLELLKLVQEKLPDVGHSQGTKTTEDNQKNVAFQEVLELTQRKFLRHMTKSGSSEESEPYPRLMVIDFLTDKEKQDKMDELRKQALGARKKTTFGAGKEGEGEADGKAEGEKSDEKGENCGELESAMKADDETTLSAEEEKNLKGVKSRYCFRLLCEYEQNWHDSSPPIFFPDLEPGDEQQIIDSAAPYLGRIYAILKHGKTQMECLNTPEGEKLQQKIEEICMKSGSDFHQEYLELRALVMQQDKALVKGKLQRCQVNGKILWLCEEHKNASRSETEKRYQDRFEQKSDDIPIPTGELPENYVAPEPVEEVRDEEMAAPKQAHRKIFKRSSEAPNKLQRQSSQMCLIS